MWVHQLDPFIIQFNQTMGIRWYGVSYICGFIAAVFIMKWMSRRSGDLLHGTQASDFLSYLIFGVIIGGRVGYCVFYEPHLLTDFTSGFPFWGVLKVYEGGMSSHGGMLGVVVASILYARKIKMSWRTTADLTVLGGSAGFFFGRLANFINGELFGRITESAVPWAVKFPTEMHLWLGDFRKGDVVSGQKLQSLTESVGHLGISPEKWLNLVTTFNHNRESYFETSGIVDRLIQATQNQQQNVINSLSLVLNPRHPSQLYAAFLEGILLFVMTIIIWRKPRNPGIVGASWLIGYSVVRVIGEQFRMPDAHIGYQIMGLTRGQILSIAQFLGSVLLLLYFMKKPLRPVGGWHKPSNH